MWPRNLDTNNTTALRKIQGGSVQNARLLLEANELSMRSKMSGEECREKDDEGSGITSLQRPLNYEKDSDAFHDIQRCAVSLIMSLI